MNENNADELAVDSSVERGIELGYEHWLNPVINSGTTDNSESGAVGSDHVDSALERRGRGRPRINTTRNNSAAEKRRAQVRAAQRNYQKRKDEATLSINQRRDDLLQVLSDLSTCVEDVLQAGSNAGTLEHTDEVGIQLRKLWSTYDAAINQPCITPELRLLRVKNSRRRADHEAKTIFRNDVTEVDASIGGGSSIATAVDPLPRGNETTLIQTFQPLPGNKVMGGRNIFDVVTERQAEFRR